MNARTKSDPEDRFRRPGVWTRFRLQWRLHLTQVESSYESLYEACQLAMLRFRRLKLRSVFFGIYEPDHEGRLVDHGGNRYHYRHVSVAVKNVFEELAALRMAGRRRLTEFRGDLEGSMAYHCFYTRDQLPYRVTDPDLMDRYVIHSLDLENRSNNLWMKRLFVFLCGGKLKRLARLMRWLNGARMFYTVEVRDTDPYEQIRHSFVSRRIGLIMFVSRRTDLTAGDFAPVVRHLKQIFYDSHLIRSHARAALQTADQLFLSLINLMPLAHIVHDFYEILYINPRGLELLGAREVAELNRVPLIEHIAPADRDRVLRHWEKLKASPAGTNVPLEDERFLRLDGTSFEVEVTAVKLDYFGKPALQVVFNDITERRTMEREREKSRLYDSLTGLPNRSLFLDRLEQAIVRRRERTASGEELIAVLAIDINGFRQINETFSFDVGDELLRQIATRMQSFMLPAYTLSRLTGDKFALFLSGIHSSGQAVFFTEGLMDIFRLQPFLLNGEEVPVSFNAGLTFCPMDGDSASELLSHCETALSRSRQHRRRLELYDHEMNTRTTGLLRLERELMQAIDAHEFRLHFQPQINRRSGQIEGIEALIRWQHPVRGLILPGEFIEVAEQRGLIIEIGEWVLREACKAAVRLHQEGHPDLSLSVNITPRQLTAPGFVRMVLDLLHDTEMSPRNLTLELIEREILEEDPTARNAMEQLCESGIRFHVDDFGTGHTAITYLRAFPIDAIKVDRSFVQDLERHGRLIQALVAFASNLGLKVIVEGVETEEQIEFLDRLDCHSYQGYFFARPLDFGQLEQFLKGQAQKGARSRTRT